MQEKVYKELEEVLGDEDIKPQVASELKLVKLLFCNGTLRYLRYCFILEHNFFALCFCSKRYDNTSVSWETRKADLKASISAAVRVIITLRTLVKNNHLLFLL